MSRARRGRHSLRRLAALGLLCGLVAALAPRPAGAAEVAPDARILVIGDSNAIAFRELPSVAWTNRLERSEDLFVQVWGGPGLSIAHPMLGLARLSECATAVPGLNSLRAAILDLGSNDYSGAVPLNDVRAGVRMLIGSVASAWICITPPGRVNETVPNAIGLTLQDYRDAIAAECESLGAVIVHGELVNPVSSRLQSDGLHLTRIGHYRLYRAVRERLRAL